MMGEAAELFAAASRRLRMGGQIVGDPGLPFDLRISLAAAELDAAQQDATVLIERLKAVSG
jgi:hypothetical protein